MPVFGTLRIKNESRWIERVIRSIQPVCDEILVFDDHSDDGTPDLCESLGCVVHRSEFSGLDESRDKDYLLSLAFDKIPAADQHFANGNPRCPYWALAIDGDEELVEDDIGLFQSVCRSVTVHAWRMRILYLWDSPIQRRVDGVYKDFNRPSLFRLMQRQFRYQKTPWGNGVNFHCSSVPQELLWLAHQSEVRLLHWGYMDRADRLRKYEWYNRIDPNNGAEDCYRHIVQGDVPEVPADARLEHAGPLRLEALA